MGRAKNAWRKFISEPMSAWVGERRKKYGEAAVFAVIAGIVLVALNLWEHIEFLSGKRKGIAVVVGAFLDVIFSPAFGYALFFAGGVALIALPFFNEKRGERRSRVGFSGELSTRLIKGDSAEGKALAAGREKKDQSPVPKPVTPTFPPTPGHYSFGDHMQLSLLHPDRYRATAMVCTVQGPDGVTVSATVYGGFASILSSGQNKYSTNYPNDFPAADQTIERLPEGTYYVTWTPQDPFSREPPVRHSITLNKDGY